MPRTILMRANIIHHLPAFAVMPVALWFADTQLLVFQVRCRPV